MTPSKDIDRALACRSAWIMNLEPGVGTGDLPKWPTVVREHETFTFGSCRLPMGDYKGEREQHTYVRNAPVCTLSKGWSNELPDQVDAVERGYALMVANYDHVEKPLIQIQPGDTPNDTPIEVQYSATAHDVMKTMVWTGYVRARTLPIHLRGAPDPCLVCRRIVEDLGDGNETIDDARTMLWSSAHLTREFCDAPHVLEVAMFYR
jgi:hypothetical protein